MTFSDRANHMKSGCSELHNGDCMDRHTFHKLYERTPKGFHAELIDGVVYVREPAGHQHSVSHIRFGTLIDVYSGFTPGSEAGSGATVLLGDQDEVEPDLFLRVLPEYGGQTQTQKSKKGRTAYVKGAPELVVEIAHTSWSIDLHLKLERYSLAGVREYVVVCIGNSSAQWFDFQQGKKIEADGQGIFHSRAFPGLWINMPAVLSMDYQAAVKTLNDGIASPEHASFVAALQARA